MRSAIKGALMVMFILCGLVGYMAQEKLRSVEQPAKFTYPNTPIEVVLRIDGKEMTDRKAHIGPDWLRRISLDVANTSGKDIVSLWINLTIREPIVGVREPDPKTAGIVMTFELTFAEPRVKLVAKGERVELRPPVQFLDYWIKYAREQGINDIEKVILDIKQVTFADGTGWYRGRFTRKDPDSGRTIFISDNSVSTFRYLPESILLPATSRLFFFWN